MALSGHQSARMLERYTHPTDGPEEWTPWRVPGLDGQKLGTEPRTNRIERSVGGRQEARTPDLRVANAALSQLS